ncbi:MAG: RnfABCDGE type electron transport complex subunit D [Spirochaetes bacterium]|nr:RnfABCDGE type electron transport complex subunit D [Spirochaetota bacterium]
MADKKIKETMKKLPVMTGAPHIRSGESIPKIMWSVIAALLPAVAFAVYHFGMPALKLMAVSVAAAVAAEALMQLLLRKRLTAHDGSAVITGLLLAMNIPPGAPLWMAAIGSVFAMIIVKHLFGGLGFNIFNPALAARAFLLASWPVHMTTSWHRFGEHNVLMQNAQNSAELSPALFDALTGATPLTLMKEGPKILSDNHVALSKLYDMVLSPDMLRSLFLGTVGGSIGETSALLLLAGGLFLMIRKIITWHIPVSFIGTVAAAAAGYHYLAGFPEPHLMALYQVLSGGLILGAFFMATDMVTSPVSKKGMLIFGAGCGLLTFVIRQWGGYPEGVSYAILIMNAFVPLIDRYTKPRVFGLRERKKLAAAAK